MVWLLLRFDNSCSIQAVSNETPTILKFLCGCAINDWMEGEKNVVDSLPEAKIWHGLGSSNFFDRRDANRN